MTTSGSAGTGPADAAARRDKPLLPRALVVLLGAGAAVLVLAGVRAVAWLVGPTFLALVVVVTLSPVQGWARRHGWPGWLTRLVLLVVVFGLVILFGLVVVISFARLAALLPQYEGHADALLTNLTTSLQRFGVSPDQLQAAAKSLNPSNVVSAIENLLGSLTSATTSLVFLFALLLFMTVEAAGMDRRLAAIAADRPGLEKAFRAYAHDTRSYLAVTTVFGLIVAVLDGVALAIAGVPLPVLWALLAFITNYIPNIGFILGLIPPALLGLLTGGWQEMLLVIGIYCLFNLVIQSLLQPRFVGDSVGLSTTVTFVALIFWAWLLGPLGALLAIPATLLVKAVLVDIDPTAGWARALFGSLEKEPRKPGGRRAAAAAQEPGPDEAVPRPRTGEEPARDPAGRPPA
jgi:AI-2 transport protein TqsA